jgi:hypothetical protein
MYLSTKKKHAKGLGSTKGQLRISSESTTGSDQLKSAQIYSWSTQIKFRSNSDQLRLISGTANN